MEHTRRLLDALLLAAEAAGASWGDGEWEAGAWRDLRDRYGRDWADLTDAVRQAQREVSLSGATPPDAPRG